MIPYIVLITTPDNNPANSLLWIYSYKLHGDLLCQILAMSGVQL